MLKIPHRKQAFLGINSCLELLFGRLRRDKLFSYTLLFALLTVTSNLLPSTVIAQNAFPCYSIPATDYNQVSIIENHYCIESASTSPVTAKYNANLVASSSISLGPGFHALPFPGYQFHARIAATSPGTPDIAWLEPTPAGVVPQYEKLELGLQFSTQIQEAIANFENGTGTPAINPFDPEQVNIQANFEHFDSRNQRWVPTDQIFGFYYKEFDRVLNNNNIDLSDWVDLAAPHHFRIRFAPRQQGQYRCVIQTNVTGFGQHTFGAFEFQCIGSENPGYVEVSDNDYYYQLSNGEPFFAIGRNMSMGECSSPDPQNQCLSVNCVTYGRDYWCYKHANPVIYTTFQEEVEELAQGGANYMRFLSFPHAMDIEYEHIGDYSNRMHMAWEMDELLALCKTKGMKMHWSMGWNVGLTHDPLGRYWNWEKDLSCPSDGSDDLDYCYSTLPGVNEILDFFTDNEAKSFYKWKLRYIIARWGYSTEIATIEFMNEVNLMGVEKSDSDCGYSLPTVQPYISSPNETAWRTSVYDWNNEMSSEIFNELDHQHHLVSSSYASGPKWPDNSEGLPNIGIIDRHRYYDPSGNSISQAMYNLQGEATNIKSANKPYLLTEIGPGDNGIKLENCDNGIEALRMSWKSAFTGMAGTGLLWMYRKQYDTYTNYSNIANLLSDVDPDNGWSVTQQQRFDKTADYMAFSNINMGRAVGVLDNYTVNYYSVRDQSLDPLVNDHDCFSNPPDPLYKNAIDINHLDGDPLRIRVATTAGKKREVFYYNAMDGTLIYSQTQYSDASGFIVLDFPTLTGNLIRPMVYFDIYPLDSKKERVIRNQPSKNRAPLQFNIFPNPSKNQFTIESDEPLQEVVIKDAMGRVLKVEKVNNLNTVNIQHQLSKGVYLVQAFGSNTQATRRIVVN